ncbi:MAG: hypothetical protein LBQ35_06195 [Spirochaetaceae bacterium]|jgi:hypothetical protein|nr:hypothetical protein [Spirochaetaceae bacterium]
MKKTLFLSALLCCAAALFAQQNNEPVYVAGAYGDYLHEFSQTGTTLESIMPHVRNGRLYFTSVGLAIHNGSLVSGDSIMLPGSQAVFATYQGNRINNIDTETPLFVAGFAETGKIVLTHIFTDYETADRWTQTLRLVHY